MSGFYGPAGGGIANPGGGGGAGGIPWVDMDYSAGTIYGNTAAVTATTGTTITIDPAEAAATFLSTANRPDYWWRTTQVDLAAWVDGPASLEIDVSLEDSHPSDGSVLGLMFHNDASPLVSTRYCGVDIHRRTNGDGIFWGINNWNSLSGNAGPWSGRQRALGAMVVAEDRTELLNWFARSLTTPGNSTNDAINLRSTIQAFAFTGLYVSIIAGTYAPAGTPPAPGLHTPIALRYRVIPST